MILYKGNIYENNKQDELINTLYQDMEQTLINEKSLTPSIVINACDILYQKVMNHEFDEIILPLLSMLNFSYERFQEMAKMFSKEGLEYKCRIELGDDYKNMNNLLSGTKRKLVPLGILFHISAGNVDGLPAFSVVEGLLSGNINILKLPTGDNGLSIKLLSELIKIEPLLKEYIYVFDVPSTETETIKKLAHMADGIVVWGGDGAVTAARSLALVNTKIIEWGHKLSFAYSTINASDKDLYDLAKHICLTNQLLCSSCQGIYVDTINDIELEKFSENFFEIFKKVNIELGLNDLGLRGKSTLTLYTDELEKKYTKVYKDKGISVVIKNDSTLELSNLFRNVWIKKLPHTNIIKELKKHKNHLQTCGLLCNNDEKEYLTDLLIKAGIVRIRKGDLSKIELGEAHDGRYPLREYTKIIEIEK